jgi:hypothetical protein
MKMEDIECSETSAYKIQTPGNHPEENIQHAEHGESLKSKMKCIRLHFYLMIVLHVSGIIITYLQEQKTTVTTASGNRYTVLLSVAIVQEMELI